MDQKELRQYEQRCIQEEPPECTAACPIHVDIRSFIGHLRNGRWKEGWLVLTRTMPLTGILGRICDAPCQARCKRGEVDDTILIGALERACVNEAHGSYRFTRMPSKGKTIAVCGSGLSSLTVAWDLIRKGYGVTLFTPDNSLCKALLTDYGNRLTQDIITTELSFLKKWGVCFETGAQIKPQAFLKQTLDVFDVIYLGQDDVDETEWGLALTPDGSLQVASQLQTTSHPKVFAGGISSSPIEQVAQGRWAATSIDRSLQNVSMLAGREKEGPYESRLFTNLDGIHCESTTPMADQKQGYTAIEAQAEAARCLMCECLECVKVCAYLEKFRAYPRKYAREIYNNESIVMGARTANILVNSCSLCGLCETVCPENFAMQTLCLQTRRQMVDKQRMPPSAHEFAIEDMTFSQGEDFFFADHAPTTTQSSHLFFPGCQLCASSPQQVKDLYQHLQAKIPGGVGLMLGCCGAPAHWAGRKSLRDSVITQLQQQWQNLNKPKLILACSTCLRMFNDFWPTAQIESVWETLAKIGVPEARAVKVKGPLALHDPCTTRDLPTVQETVRKLIAQLGVDIVELPLTRSQTECCGYGGLMQNANPQIAKEVIRRRADLSENDYLTYCAMCRDNLTAVNKRSLHLLDLIFRPNQEVPDPADRPRPGWSQRRENRARLKRSLLEDLWKKKESKKTGQTPITINLAPGVAEILEERRILLEDIRQVIAYAQGGGAKLRHPKTGHFKASYKPRHVTFWVEYTPNEKGFEVFNAYSHRMEVKHQ
ncbi:MAG: heterodisulfide reductase-related iron-sulfur binding cluster [Desulfobacteraceae bacterium]|jgi:NADPH-dependent glutamate synthase beta subunit-like oxidoreductase